ncbi:MAG: mono/diheme cytochrome c family protein [Myxococcota bacterium]|jgi:mono/diheme cytochrome c family protein
MTETTNDNGELYGVIAEFDDVTTLCNAAEKVREAGYTKWDCHTPFPVHGLDDRMGIKFTKLPWIVLVMGLTGCGLAVLMQWWMNAVDYPYDISGKPRYSLPANVPIIFEMTVLFSAFTAFFGMWIANGLPLWYNPLFRSTRFAKVTDDKFFVAIEAADGLFDGAKAHEFLSSLGATVTEDVYHSNESPKLPSNLKGKMVVLACLATIPVAMVYNSYGKTTTETRVHLVPDMDKQDRFRAQGKTDLFADGRMSRAQVVGTIAQGDLEDHSNNVVNAAFLDRGEERFNIYCSVCHGFDGKGEGTVHDRASELADAGHAAWVPPSDLTNALYADQTDEQIYTSITDGIRTMPGYGEQIPERDRWAIIAYVRALQVAQQVEAPSTSGMTSVERGELLFTSKTCVACHNVTGTRLVGPPLNGLLGQEITLDDGTTMTIDEAYIIESIMDPMAKAQATYPKAMAAVPLTDEELTDLLNYLESQN